MVRLPFWFSRNWLFSIVFHGGQLLAFLKECDVEEAMKG